MRSSVLHGDTGFATEQGQVPQAVSQSVLKFAALFGAVRSSLPEAEAVASSLPIRPASSCKPVMGSSSRSRLFRNESGTVVAMAWYCAKVSMWRVAGPLRAVAARGVGQLTARSGTVSGSRVGPAATNVSSVS